jgi:type I restriction enzyme S subunit
VKQKPYPAYKKSGIDWLGAIPEHWGVKKLKWFCNFVKSGEGISPDDIESAGGHPVYGGNGIMGYTPGYNSSGDDIIIGRVGAKCGNVYYVTGKKWISDNALYLDTNKCEKTYLQYFLSARNLNQLANQNAQPLITGSMVGNQFVLLPSLSDQRSIAAFLDRETARIDTLIDKKERQIELLQEKRAALISHVVTKGLDPNVKMKDSGIEWLGEIPKSWTTIQVKRCFEVQLGKMLQNNPELDTDVSVPYIKALHVLWGRVNTADLQEMWASPMELAQFEVKSGDLLICEGGEAGRAGIVSVPPTPCIIQNALHRVRGKNADVRFLQYVLHAVSRRGWFDVLCNKSTIAHFTREKLAELRIPSPPTIDEQGTIATYLDRETGKIDNLISKVQDSINKLHEYRTALISATVTGKIDVREEVA